MSILNVQKSIKLFNEKAEILGVVYEYNLVQKRDELNKFVGSIKKTSEKGLSDGIVWDVVNYDIMTITVKGASKTQGKEIKKIAEELSKHIISKQTRLNSDFIKFYNSCKKNPVVKESIIEEDDVKMNANIKEEIAITKEMPKTLPPKVQVSEVVKDFMRTYDTSKLVETLELAVAKFNEAQEDIALLEERLAEAKPLDKEIIRLKQKIEGLLYDKEQLTHERDLLVKENDKVFEENEGLKGNLKLAYEQIEYSLPTVVAPIITPEDPDDDPKGGQSIPAFDVAEFKAQLKAEIIAELKEEFKALSVPAEVAIEKEVNKPSTIKLPAAIETETKIESKKEEIVEKPKTKKLSELTLDDLNNMEYKKLQKLGSALKLGSANVANKADLINIIATKLKLVTKSAPVINKVEVESLNVSKTISSNSSVRATNETYTEEYDAIEDELFLDEFVEEEVSAVDQLVGMTFEDPAKQRLADLVLSRRK